MRSISETGGRKIKKEISYEVTFEIIRKGRGNWDRHQHNPQAAGLDHTVPNRYFQAFGKKMEVNRFVVRMIKLALRDRNLKMPPDPKNYSELILAKYPSVGYAYRIVKVVRIAKVSRVCNNLNRKSLPTKFI